MKKIEFGFNDDNRLNAQWSGIEFYNGEYLDVVAYEGFDFLVTRIVDSQHGLNGNIDVREIAQDYYADGSYVTYANMEKNDMCKRLERLLNSPKLKEKLANNQRAFSILRDEGISLHISNLNAVQSKFETVSYVVTSVKPEIFRSLKDSKRNGGRSMYDQTLEIARLRAEIEKMKSEGFKRNGGRSH